MIKQIDEKETITYKFHVLKLTEWKQYESKKQTYGSNYQDISIFESE
jgi:hypothetical protein